MGCSKFHCLVWPLVVAIGPQQQIIEQNRGSQWGRWRGHALMHKRRQHGAHAYGCSWSSCLIVPDMRGMGRTALLAQSGFWAFCQCWRCSHLQHQQPQKQQCVLPLACFNAVCYLPVPLNFPASKSSISLQTGVASVRHLWHAPRTCRDSGLGNICPLSTNETFNNFVCTGTR